MWKFERVKRSVYCLFAAKRESVKPPSPKTPAHQFAFCGRLRSVVVHDKIHGNNSVICVVILVTLKPALGSQISQILLPWRYNHSLTPFASQFNVIM